MNELWPAIAVGTTIGMLTWIPLIWAVSTGRLRLCYHHEWELVDIAEPGRFKGTGLVVVVERCTKCDETRNTLKPGRMPQ